MNFCIYCGRNAKIDEDLGTCKYCGAVRITENLNEIVKGDKPLVSKISDSKFDIKKTKKSAIKKKYVKKNRNQQFGCMMITTLIIFTVFITGFIGEIYFSKSSSTDYCQLNISVIDEITGKYLNDIDVSIFDLSSKELIEVITSSGRMIQSDVLYLYGTTLGLFIDGNNYYCDVYYTYKLLPISNEYIDVLPISISTVKLPTEFTMGLRAFDYSIIGNNTQWNTTDELQFQLMVRNMESKTGYINSYNFVDNIRNNAYVYIKYSGSISSGYYNSNEYLIQTPIETYLIFPVNNKRLYQLESQILYNVIVLVSFTFDKSMKYTFEYGLVLNADVEYFMERYYWGYGALIYNNIITIDVI